MIKYCRLYFCYLILISELIFSQNFRYNPDDWYILTRPGSINAITEDNFKLYFATDNGVFSYDKSMEDFSYDYNFSNQLEFPQIQHMIYDSYRDYFWVIHSGGISYKSSVSSIWREMSLSNSGIFSHFEIDDMGASPEFIWIRSMNELYPFDPFSATTVNWDEAQDDINLIKWGSSRYGIAGEAMDISSYSIYGDWSIGLNNITHPDGRSMYATLYMDDDDGNKWFGTTEGYILKGWRNSTRLELLTIGLPFDHVTSAYHDQEGNWWFADSHYKRTGRLSDYEGLYQTSNTPFITQWREADNQWTYYTPKESILIEHTDVNAILRVGSTIYFGTMFGLLYLDLYNQDWNLINTTNGLNDRAVWDIIEYNGSIYVATARGINEISIINHSLIPDQNNRFEPLSEFNIYDMAADTNFIYFATNMGLLKMDWENGYLTILSKKEFRKINLNDNNITGTDGSLWLIKNGMEEQYITFNAHDFDICGSYIWSSQRGLATLLDTVTTKVWEYGQEDGMPGQKVYGTYCDEDWVLFLTNRGVAFYNWERYHHEKN